MTRFRFDHYCPGANAGAFFTRGIVLHYITRKRYAPKPVVLPPRTYFAGKISRLCWRCEILGDSRAGGVDENEVFDPSHTVKYDGFLYGGPFFVSCDHGCFHGPGSHGASGGCTEDLPVPYTRSRIWQANYERICRSHFMFAYVNEVDCYGTMVEIGVAVRTGIPIALSFGRALTRDQCDEMWMLAAAADAIYTLPPALAWRQAFAEFGLKRDA